MATTENAISNLKDMIELDQLDTMKTKLSLHFHIFTHDDTFYDTTSGIDNFLYDRSRTFIPQVKIHMYASPYSDCDLNQISAPFFIIKKLNKTPHFLTVFNSSTHHGNTEIKKIDYFKRETDKICKFEKDFGFTYDMELVESITVDMLEALAKSKWRQGILPIMNVLYPNKVFDC